MLQKFRFVFIFFIFMFLSFLFGLATLRNIYLGGSLEKNYGIQIKSLAEILPNIYHLIINQTGVENLFVPIKKTFNADKFNVPGLYSYLSKHGWVILDKKDSNSTIIPIKWENLKNYYFQKCKGEECINSKFAAAPINPLKISENLIFHLGSVLFKYNLKSNEFYAFTGKYHHSIEQFQDSLIYVCSLGDDTLNIRNDQISLININSNEIIYTKSIPEILIKNNLKGLLFGFNNIVLGNNDLIHVNDIQPVRRKTNFAQVGDLFLSFRHLSTVILYRPSTDSILWYSSGPWLNQHDVDILNDDIIGIYNNNNIREGKFLKDTYSNITTYNFKTKQFDIIYEQIFRKLKIQSMRSSRFEVLDNGEIFIEDSPSGMYYLISKEGKLISSKNFQFDDKNAIVSLWARPYNTLKY